MKKLLFRLYDNMLLKKNTCYKRANSITSQCMYACYGVYYYKHVKRILL